MTHNLASLGTAVIGTALMKLSGALDMDWGQCITGVLGAIITFISVAEKVASWQKVQSEVKKAKAEADLAEFSSEKAELELNNLKKYINGNHEHDE
jgi:hypothetical protein